MAPAGTNQRQAGGKRKRQQSHSEQDKFAHKSSVLLQREAKKVRAFQVRKVVQQLKQTRSQLEAAQREHEELSKHEESGGGDAGDKLAKKDKQVKKLRGTVSKLEKELAVLKALELKAVVARAMEKTGLAKKAQEAQQQKLQEQMQQRQSYVDSEEDESDDDDDDASGSDDDGFDSEEYENARKKTAVGAGAAGGDGDESGSDSESESESEEQDETEAAPVAEEAGESAEPMEQSSEEPKLSVDAQKKQESNQTVSAETVTEALSAEQEQEKEETAVKAKAQANADLQLQNALIDRILAHKQMKPLLEAIEKVLEKEERETEKKLRKQEKKALKRDRNEVLIGGRSSAAPTSLFLGSLSGRGGALDDDVDMGVGMSSSYMDGAEDDIAEFLGEKKKKNRMGQNARRQKAIRMEESAKRKQDRENGIFRPFLPRKEDTLSKYGPSERPKKKKPAAEVQSKGKSSSGRGKPSGRDGKPERGGEQRRGGDRGGNGRERERGAPPAPRASSAVSSSSRPAPPKVEPSHPSWLAKQALKEKEKASITAFSGKKITFGDD